MWLSNSSIGRKVVMSVTGLALILFLTFHMAMNLVAIFSAEAYDMICAFLGANWYALIATAGLGFLVVVHIVYAFWLTMQNRAARGSERYAVNAIKRKSPGPVHYDGEPYMMDRELLVEVVPGGLNVLALPGWDGTCVPVPLYRQIREVMEGAVAELPAFPSFPSFNSKWWVVGK